MDMDISVLGVDLGKNVCSVVGLDASGAVVLRRRAKRQTLIALAAKLPPCVVAMEACCGAHHLGRVFAGHGHDVGLTSPESVRPYVKAQKNDDRDVERIAEAATRPTMRFVGPGAARHADASLGWSGLTPRTRGTSLCSLLRESHSSFKVSGNSCLRSWIY